MHTRVQQYTPRAIIIMCFVSHNPVRGVRNNKIDRHAYTPTLEVYRRIPMSIFLMPVSSSSLSCCSLIRARIFYTYPIYFLLGATLSPSVNRIVFFARVVVFLYPVRRRFPCCVTHPFAFISYWFSSVSHRVRDQIIDHLNLVSLKD